MEPVEIEVEETIEETVECGPCECKPFALVRFREAWQGDARVEDAKLIFVDDGLIQLLNGKDEILFAAPHDTVLSIQIIK